MKILIVDNYDSFTYNLLHLLNEVVSEREHVYIVKNDRLVFDQIPQYDKIIISPGPGIPSEAGLLMELLREFHQTKSILGVCLGFHAIGEVLGAKLVNSEKVFHGIESEIRITDHSSLFAGLPEHIRVGRYHSWVVDPQTIPECLTVTARADDGHIMAFSHREHDVHGVQFHPESFLTPQGKTILKNFIYG